MTSIVVISAGELAALTGGACPTRALTSRRRTLVDGFSDPTPFELLLKQAAVA